MLMEKYTEASSGFEFKIGGFRIDLFWIIPIGLFFFPTTVRGMLLDSEIFRAVNIVAWFAILIFYVTGVLAHRYKVFQGTEIVYTAIAVIAMAITTSKMGIVLILVGILYFNFNRKRIRYIVIMTLVGYATYSIGLFDAILERFNVAFSSGDITTGRNTALVALYSSGALSFDLLGGAGFTNMSTAMIAALEYPLLRLAYRHGIIYAVIVLLSVFVIPAIRLIRAHKMDLFVALLLIALDINTFDSIASVGDYMLIYCTFACLLMNLTDMDYEKVIPDRKKKIDIRLRG